MRCVLSHAFFSTFVCDYTESQSYERLNLCPWLQAARVLGEDSRHTEAQADTGSAAAQVPEQQSHAGLLMHSVCLLQKLENGG